MRYWWSILIIFSFPVVAAPTGKALCIADDLSPDYSGCSTLNESTCHHPDKRCEFSVVRGCHPRSVDSCERALNKSKSSTKIILTYREFLELQSTPRFADELKNFRRVELFYAGHGPELAEWIALIQNTLLVARDARQLIFRSLGCSTFRDPPLAQREWENSLAVLPPAVLDRLRNVHVEITANQLAVASLPEKQIRAEKTDLEDLTQTPFTFTVNWTPDAEKGFEVVPFDAYPCRADLELPVQAPIRKCLEEDGLVERNTLCRSTRKNWKIETCGRYHYLSDRIDPHAPRTYALVSARKYNAVVIRPPDIGGNPAMFTYAGAVVACQERKGRLGEFYEIKAALENGNLFAAFETFASEKNRFNSAWVWTNTPVPDQPGYRYRYRWDSQFLLSSSADLCEEARPDGFVACIIDPAAGDPKFYSPPLPTDFLRVKL
jgi:hypothetical protein